jgi:hypothetical protein
VTDAEGRPIRFFLTAGQVSDYSGALALLSSLPGADWLLGDKGYRAIVRHGFEDDGEGRLVQGRPAGQGHQVLHPRPQLPRHPGQTRQAPLQTTPPHREHVRAPQGLAPRRHAAHDRCPKLFLSTITLAATGMFWLRVVSVEDRKTGSISAILEPPDSRTLGKSPLPWICLSTGLRTSSSTHE